MRNEDSRFAVQQLEESLKRSCGLMAPNDFQVSLKSSRRKIEKNGPQDAAAELQRSCLALQIVDLLTKRCCKCSHGHGGPHYHL